MLPFMKHKMQTGVIVNTRKPDGSHVEDGMEGDDQGMEAVAEDMIRAFSTKDSKALAAALRAAFEIADSEPHVEGEHLDEEEV